MINKTLYFLLLSIITSLPFVLYSCCANEPCAEDDTFGKTVIHKTDTVYKKVPRLESGPYYVQIGAFVNKDNADAFSNKARDILKTSVEIQTTYEGLIRIVVGEYKEIQDAIDMLKYIKSNGYSNAFIRDEFGSVER